MAWPLMCGCMCGGVYVSQLLPFTAGLAGSMQEYEVWLGVWRGNGTLNGQSIFPRPRVEASEKASYLDGQAGAHTEAGHGG